MLLFLDFDGVLRPRRAPPGRFHPACLANFEDLLREFAEIDVVISSDWRILRPVEMLRGFFSEDIQPRIIGATPWLKNFDDGCRHREILAYLQTYEEDPRRAPRWLAVDDTPELFPDEVIGDRVVILDPDRALDAFEAERLRVFVIDTLRGGSSSADA